MNAITLPNRRLTVAEFLEWAKTQPEEARFELVDGEVVPRDGLAFGMGGDTIQHNRAKKAVSRAFDKVIEEAGLPCESFVDGVAIRIDAESLRIPDVLVQCGSNPDDQELIADNPLIVVEVLSRSSGGNDTGAKLVEYFAVPSIQHYLIIDPGKRYVIHHRKGAGTEGIQTRIARDGVLDLTPPGISVPVARLLGAA